MADALREIDLMKNSFYKKIALDHLTSTVVFGLAGEDLGSMLVEANEAREEGKYFYQYLLNEPETPTVQNAKKQLLEKMISDLDNIKTNEKLYKTTISEVRYMTVGDNIVHEGKFFKINDLNKNDKGNITISGINKYGQETTVLKNLHENDQIEQAFFNDYNRGEDSKKNLDITKQQLEEFKKMAADISYPKIIEDIDAYLSSAS